MKKTIGKQGWWLVCVWALAFAPLLNGQISFEAVSDAREVFLDGEVEVSFVLRNAMGNKFTPPDFKDFTVLSGPNQSSRSSLVNGVRSTELGISFILRPKRKGLLTIGSASVEVDKKKFYTKQQQVSVIDGERRSGEGTKVAFIKAETNISEAWPGQQILLDYKIYIQTQYFKQGHEVETKPDYAGFFAEQLNYYRSFKEIVNGVEYNSMTLARLAIFPQRSGDLVIPPLAILLDVGERRSNPFGMGLAPIERIKLESNKLTVRVKPFPDPAPGNFFGVSGKYSIGVTANRTELSTDDALSIKLTIRGDGDIKQVSIPVLTGVDSFEMFKPNVLSETLQDSGNGFMTGEKVIEYLLTPRAPGKYNIPLQFSYWDSEAKAYADAAQDTLRLTVVQGTGKPTIADGSTGEEGRNKLLGLILSGPFQKKDGFWIQSPLFWVTVSLPFLTLLGLLLVRRWQTREDRMDPLTVRERRLRKVVDQHLSAARARLQAGQFKDLFEEVSRALTAYLGHKLGIPPSKWSKNRVREQLQEARVDESIISRVMEVLQTSEMALYAAQDKQEAAQRVFDQASQVIREMEIKK